MDKHLEDLLELANAIYYAGGNPSSLLKRLEAESVFREDFYPINNSQRMERRYWRLVEYPKGKPKTAIWIVGDHLSQVLREFEVQSETKKSPVEIIGPLSFDEMLKKIG